MTKHVLPPHPKTETGKDDPLWWRALRHSNDVGLAVLPVVISGIVLAIPFAPGFEPSKSLAGLPGWISLGLASIIGTGGVLACLGLLWTGKVISTGWTLERTGWLLVFGGWDGYAVAVFFYFPHSTMGWIIPGFLGALGVIRLVAVWWIERLIRPSAEKVKRVREALEEGP